MVPRLTFQSPDAVCNTSFLNTPLYFTLNYSYIIQSHTTEKSTQPEFYRMLLAAICLMKDL